MKRGGQGNGTRYESPGAVLNKEMMHSEYKVYVTPPYCPVCGKHRSPARHDKCSKILQAKFKES